jgi:hypothetical protein
MVTFPELCNRGFALWSYTIQPSGMLTILCESSGSQAFNIEMLSRNIKLVTI